MKTLKHIGAFLMLLMVLSANKSQAQTIVRNGSNQVVGYFDSSIFHDLNSTGVLDFSTAGEVHNWNDDIAATYNTSTGEIHDVNNELLYTIDGTTIKNESGLTIGSITEAGEVKDLNGDVLYSAQGINKYHMVYLALVYNRI